MRPTGYRSPSWDFSPHTLDLLRDLDFDWDSSLMGHDFEPYYLHETGEVNPDEPYQSGPKTDIIEFPVSWHRDDWPAFQVVPGQSMPASGFDESETFDLWQRQFDWMRTNVEDGVFSLTFHPQVIAQHPGLRISRRSSSRCGRTKLSNSSCTIRLRKGCRILVSNPVAGGYRVGKYPVAGRM